MPLSYLRLVFDYIEAVGDVTSLDNILIAIADKLMPGCSNEFKLEILLRRKCNMEAIEDVRELASMEEVLDFLDDNSKTALSKEIEGAKKQRAEFEGFSSEYTKYKARQILR